MKIFAFPYAFGNISTFRELQEKMSKITLIPMEYPGHGTRYIQPFCSSIFEIALDAYEQIKEKLISPYCLLGYSMGALVAFELCRIIENHNSPAPNRIFLFASDSPGCKRNSKDFCNYADFNLEKTQEILGLFGNTPKEILDDENMMKILLPIVKNDINIMEEYCNEDHNGKKINSCPVTIIRGSRELSNKSHGDNWEKFIDNDTELIIIEGGHFFMFDNKRGFNNCLDIVMKRLKEYE